MNRDLEKRVPERGRGKGGGRRTADGSKVTYRYWWRVPQPKATIS